MDTMLAGRLHLDSMRFAVEEVPVPVPGPGEVLIEVRAAGVCLSDVHLLDGTIQPFHPVDGNTVTLGHEVAGVIHTLGPGLLGDWAPGMRVALQAGQTCGRCANCMRRLRPCMASHTRGVDYDGGWAQYALAREDTLAPIPDNLPFDQAARFRRCNNKPPFRKASGLDKFWTCRAAICFNPVMPPTACFAVRGQRCGCQRAMGSSVGLRA